MDSRWRWLTLALILGVSVGCDDTTDVPSAPAPVSTPAPRSENIRVITVPVQVATPSPAPTPCANGNMPVAFVEVTVYSVRTESGASRRFDSLGPFWVGETLRFDSQGYDIYQHPTDGCRDDGPRWGWSPQEIVDWNGLYGWMPSATSLAPGQLTVIANFGSAAGAITLTFLPR